MFLLAAQPAVPAGPPQWMNAFDLRSAFDGVTVTGAYASGLQFTETYRKGGAITYRDEINTDSGKWYIWGQKLCTFYVSLNGACFNIRKLGENCFQAYPADAVAGITDEKALEPFLTAQLWRTDRISTCPTLPIA
jgi:hypothetical protein